MENGSGYQAKFGSSWKDDVGESGAKAKLKDVLSTVPGVQWRLNEHNLPVYFMHSDVVMVIYGCVIVFVLANACMMRSQAPCDCLIQRWMPALLQLQLLLLLLLLCYDDMCKL